MFNSWKTLGRAPSLSSLLYIPHSGPWDGKLLLECGELEKDIVGTVSDILKTNKKADRTGERKKKDRMIVYLRTEERQTGAEGRQKKKSPGRKCAVYVESVLVEQEKG